VGDPGSTQRKGRKATITACSPRNSNELADLEIAIGNKLRDFSIIKDILYISPLLLAYVCARLFNRHPPTRDPQRGERRASCGLADVTLNVHWHGSVAVHDCSLEKAEVCIIRAIPKQKRTCN
jgi:hypothetical protein